MKQLKLFLIATSLTLMLSISASAGQMQTGIAPPPPDQPTVSVEGQMQTGITAPNNDPANNEAAASNLVTETALQLILSALSLF